MSRFPQAIEHKNWFRDVDKLHKSVAHLDAPSQRASQLAQAMVGLPYRVNPLHGGPDQDERLVLDLSAFDCVTLVETVLALARSRDRAGFVAELCHCRYQGGQIQWPQRLHYFHDWLAANARRGALDPLPEANPSSQAKTLGLLAGLPTRHVNLRYCPRSLLRSKAHVLGETNVVAFASTRAQVDYFHVGILFWQGPPQQQKLQLVHASRSLAGVVSEALGQFLRRNRMRGLALAKIRDF